MTERKIKESIFIGQVSETYIYIEKGFLSKIIEELKTIRFAPPTNIIKLITWADKNDI